MKKILILFAHPAFQKSRANKQLVAGIDKIEGVTFHDLYQHYPEFDIDVAREQELLMQHDIIVFHHPFFFGTVHLRFLKNGRTWYWNITGHMEAMVMHCKINIFLM